jgi:hypothetical protein
MSTNTSLTPSVAATSLDLLYEIRQDRMLLTARTAEVGVDLFLTRRLTRALLSGLLDLMMRTSDLVSRSGHEHRSDVLLFEHMEAVARIAGPAEPVTRVTPDLAAEIHSHAPILVEKVDVTTGANALRLSFHDGAGERAWIALPREKVHQFIAMLLTKCQEASWDLGELAWIDRRGQIIIPADTRLC